MDALSIILALALLASCQVYGQSLQGTNKWFKRVEGPLMLRPGVKYSVWQFSNVELEFHCISKCHLVDCAVIYWNQTNQTCQLVSNLTSSDSADNSSQQTIGPFPAGASVWKADNFIDLVKLSITENQNMTFTSNATGRNGSIQLMDITIPGCYRIELGGARGGASLYYGLYGGRGATVSGNFVFNSTNRLSIVVGQMGNSVNLVLAGAGGGGGSFVYRTQDNFLLIAAGGGGGASRMYAGLSGLAGINGGNSIGDDTSSTGFGGSNGQPGFKNPSSGDSIHTQGGSGAGWLGKTVLARRSSLDGDNGGGRAEGWIGGIAGVGNLGHGGFGGGGGGGVASTTQHGTPGAGGGYSGGGAGVFCTHSGGGGGSYCGGIRCNATTGGNMNNDNGFVVIQLVAQFANTC